jgi:hypothetical protein
MASEYAICAEVASYFGVGVGYRKKEKWSRTSKIFFYLCTEIVLKFLENGSNQFCLLCSSTLQHQ